MYMPIAETGPKKRHKMEDRFCTGVYLGLVDRSDSVIVGTASGCYVVNCIKRLPPIQQGDRRFVESICGLPWKMVPAEVEHSPDELPIKMATAPTEQDLPELEQPLGAQT